MINRLTDSLDFHAQALSLRAERQRLIASNIANADTPGFQARDFDFASALRTPDSRAGVMREQGASVSRASSAPVTTSMRAPAGAPASAASRASARTSASRGSASGWAMAAALASVSSADMLRAD